MPAVSVVIPLYQTERYIAETLQSVLAQTFRDFEVLVVDDGSTDGGPAIARGTGDDRVRVITQANRGLSGARNTGIREARAPLVAFLDADDLWDPTKLARHVAHLAEHPDVGVSFSGSELIDEAGRHVGAIAAPAGPIDVDAIVCFNPLGNGSTPVIRRAVLDAIAFHDERVERICWFDESFRQSEDVECWTRIAATTRWRIAGIDAPLTRYRLNAASLSANVEKQFRSWQSYRAKVRSFAPAVDARCGDKAEAYQRRYLARKAVRAGEGITAVRMMARALAGHPAMLAEDPGETLKAVLAGCGAALLPSRLYQVCRRAVAPGPGQAVEQRA